MSGDGSLPPLPQWGLPHGDHLQLELLVARLKQEGVSVVESILMFHWTLYRIRRLFSHVSDSTRSREFTAFLAWYFQQNPSQVTSTSKTLQRLAAWFRLAESVVHDPLCEDAEVTAFLHALVHSSTTVKHFKLMAPRLDDILRTRPAEEPLPDLIRHLVLLLRMRRPLLERHLAELRATTSSETISTQSSSLLFPSVTRAITAASSRCSDDVDSTVPRSQNNRAGLMTPLTPSTNGVPSEDFGVTPEEILQIPGTAKRRSPDTYKKAEENEVVSPGAKRRRRSIQRFSHDTEGDVLMTELPA